MGDLVLAESTGDVFVATLNEPARKNPLSDPMIESLIDALTSPAAQSAGMVVLRGAGGTFSAGGDIRQFRNSLSTDAGDQLEATDAFRRLFLVLDDLPGMTMAAVQGGAFGGGCGLVAACDIALATASARFGCPEIRLGAFPMVITPALVRAIGPRATAALGTSGDTITSARARELGLAWEVVDDDKFDDAVTAWIERAANTPAQVLRMGKMSIRAGQAAEYRVGLESGSVLRALLFSSPAFHRGVTEFMDRAKA